EDRDLERRRVARVADERVGELERYRVHRAAGHDAEMLQAEPAEVLHGREQPGLDDLHGFIRSNSARDTGTKRTWSPGANRLGGLRSGLKSGSGVRPITCQPPGVS